MSLRDPEFAESMEGFFTSSALDSTRRLPEDKVCRNNVCTRRLIKLVEASYWNHPVRTPVWPS